MNYRRLVKLQLLLLLLLAAAAVAVYLPERALEENEGISRKTLPLVELPVYEISAAAVINDKARFGLIHQEGRITLEPLPQGLSPSPERLQAFLFRLSKLEASGLLEKGGPLSEYGLDEPAARITLIKGDGEKIRFGLGRKNPSDGSYYMRRNEEETIYLLSAGDAELFLSTPADFESLNLLPRVELKDLNQLESLSLEFPGGDFPSYTLENMGDFLFRLISPIDNSVSYERTLSDLIFPVLSLSATQQLSEDSAAARTDEAGMILKVRIAGEEYELSFYPEGLVRRQGAPGVYRLEEGSPSFRSLRYSDLLEGAAYHINVSEIESVILHDGIDGIDYNIDFEGEATEIHSRMNGMELAYPETMELYKTLFRMTIASELETPMASSAEYRDLQSPSLEMVIHKKNGSLDKLQFVPIEEGELLLVVDGRANFTSYNKTVLDIRALLSRIAAKEGA